MLLLFRFICPKVTVTGGRRGRQRGVPPVGSLPDCLEQLGLDQAKVRDQELLRLSPGEQVPGAWAIICCFPGTLAGRCIGSKVPGTGTRHFDQRCRHPK